MTSPGGDRGLPGEMLLRTGGFGVAVAMATGLGLWVTQPNFGLSTLALFVPLAATGVLVAIGAARLPLPSRQSEVGDEPRRSEEGPHTLTPQSDPSDRYDDVDYLGALRHEFRTPLNAVLGFADVLLGGIDGTVNESQREDLEIIRASGMKLRVLLDSALDLSLLATGDLKPEAESTDARALVQRAADEAAQLWAGKRAPSVQLASGPCLIMADEARLRRSILVLADFLAAENRDAEIEIELGRSEDHLVVSITANPSTKLTLEALPTPSEVFSAEDPLKIRRWPVAITSEVLGLDEGTLYHGDDPARFVIRLPKGGTE